MQASFSRESKMRFLALTFVLVNLFDMMLTISALQTGKYELNMFMRAVFDSYGAGAAVLFKLTASAFVAWVFCLFRLEHALKIAVIAMLVVVLSNLVNVWTTVLA